MNIHLSRLPGCLPVPTGQTGGQVTGYLLAELRRSGEFDLEITLAEMDFYEWMTSIYRAPP